MSKPLETIEASASVNTSAPTVAPTRRPGGTGTSLFCAAESGIDECVRFLLAAGASVAQRDDLGRTALFLARSAGVAQLLIKAGVDLAATDDNGRDALDAALERGARTRSPRRFDVAAALISAGMEIEGVGAWPHSRISLCALRQDADAVTYLLNRGVSLKPPSGAPTALHCICLQGEHPGTSEASERIIRELVAAGIPLEALNDQGRTALHDAAEGDWGNPTAVRTLLALGAGPDPVDAAGWTPLMLAATRGETECVRLLLDAGADPTRTDSDGSCALDGARAHQATWAAINASEESPHRDDEASAAAWKEALDEAAGCVNLLQKAIRGNSRQGLSTPPRPAPGRRMS